MPHSPTRAMHVCLAPPFSQNNTTSSPSLFYCGSPGRDVSGKVRQRQGWKGWGFCKNKSTCTGGEKDMIAVSSGIRNLLISFYGSRQRKILRFVSFRNHHFPRNSAAGHCMKKGRGKIALNSPIGRRYWGLSRFPRGKSILQFAHLSRSEKHGIVLLVR